ncbi:MAG TPA: 4-hydroxybenzoate 3-monooxygenase [Micropepsaceae bacterium]|nr:4-hydroxybenzoate 3-monooxygenase [Micropepsaceae bacterium]
MAIIGGGPAGLLLSQLLHLSGVDNIVLERRSRAHVEGRIRAGVLESGTAELLHRARAGARMQRDALLHDGFSICFGDNCLRVDVKALAGTSLVVYGQTEITRDLYELHLGAGAPIVFEAEDAVLHDIATHPRVTYRQNGKQREIACDFIAGCDGFHGVSRASFPAAASRSYERSLPFGWLGVLSETPPVDDELIYSRSARGFALCSMRSRHLSRYYVQCPLSDSVAGWPDARFWDELRRRIPDWAASRLITGPSLEKSIAPLRSFVCEPMAFGRLFLAGDAAHIVPPTGAKGLNLAAADAGELAEALVLHYRERDGSGLENYSARSLRRAWAAVRFSWWMTMLTHPMGDEFSDHLQSAEFEMLKRSQAAAELLAQNYCGMGANRKF